MNYLLCFLISSYLLLSIMFVKGYSVRINQTDSLPYSLYLATPANNFKLKQIVSFTKVESPVLFAKRIAGLPGDRITIKEAKIYINDQELDSIRTSLLPITPGLIPAGYFFAWGEGEKSFDSRYAEFGLVSQSSIQEILWPLY